MAIVAAAARGRQAVKDAAGHAQEAALRATKRRRVYGVVNRSSRGEAHQARAGTQHAQAGVATLPLVAGDASRIASRSRKALKADAGCCFIFRGQAVAKGILR
jgi:hypothetical protein